jgi:hypothetical protein
MPKRRLSAKVDRLLSSQFDAPVPRASFEGVVPRLFEFPIVVAAESGIQHSNTGRNVLPSAALF